MFNKEELNFKKELNSLIDKFLPENWQKYPDERLDYDWELSQKIKKELAKNKWIAPSWPKKYGGLDQGISSSIILSETFAYRMSPGNDRFGVRMIGPTLLKYGSDYQKEKYLKEITNGDVQWCQGYSEPNSGSDLASISTKGEYDEENDTITINGTKVWTTLGHRADRMFILVRTLPDSSRHKGLSLVLIDMKDPGIKINPIKNISGSSSFNEVVLSNVKTSGKNVVGKLHEGWMVALDLLNFERSGIDYIGWAERCLDDVEEYCNEKKILSRDDIKINIASLRSSLESAKIMTYKALWIKTIDEKIHMEPSMSKLLATEINIKIHDFAFDILSKKVTIDTSNQDEFAKRIFKNRLFFISGGILGGTTEIQKNIIAQRGLGLPK
jgi:alkylation response protein AidB-like acyl-CoA dehydrogenase|tara:strand:- start:5810 stop:6961 length:1152 start_codon:yes stop_codon:yes gene_type:complete